MVKFLLHDLFEDTEGEDLSFLQCHFLSAERIVRDGAAKKSKEHTECHLS